LKRWHRVDPRSPTDALIMVSVQTTAMDFEFDTCLWDEIQDAPGEIFDVEAWEQEAAEEE